MRTWVDASTLIAIDLAGEVEVLRTLLGRVSVTKEVAAGGVTGREARGLPEGAGAGVGGGGGGGAGGRLVLDEIPARTVAEAEGRAYVGLLGLLLAGVRRGLLTRDRAREVLRKVVESGFHLASPD